MKKKKKTVNRTILEVNFFWMNHKYDLKNLDAQEFFDLLAHVIKHHNFVIIRYIDKILTQMKLQVYFSYLISLLHLQSADAYK